MMVVKFPVYDYSLKSNIKHVEITGVSYLDEIYHMFLVGVYICKSTSL